MVRINPGSNVHGDNKTGTAVPGMVNVDIPEPKMIEKGKYECPVCGKTFNSREGYDSHAMAHHQRNPEMISPASERIERVEETSAERTVSRTEFECTTT